MKTTWPVKVGKGCFRHDISRDSLFLSVPDVSGSYTVPYIQTNNFLEVEAEDIESDWARITLTLQIDGEPVADGILQPDSPKYVFAHLDPGEYTLDVVVYDGEDSALFCGVINRVGIGAIIAALGGSIMEGYYGSGFFRNECLCANDFPTEAVSGNGRNFPQYAPTTHLHLPEVNCFKGCMTDLNDLLSESLNQPVLIANEGWGGYSTSNYLNLMKTDAGWKERMKLLEPDMWLIHLGVNDERAFVEPGEMAANLEAIVGILTSEYGARAEQILLARPSYDYFPGAEKILAQYCGEINRLSERLGLKSGPDFFSAYAKDKDIYYGEDPVHPNEEGFKLMARLWHDAIMAKGCFS